MPSRVECTVYCHRRVVGQPSELPERGCTANSDHMASHRAMPRTILEHYTLGNATSSVLLSVTIELHRSRDCRASSSVASGSKTLSDSGPCVCDTSALM
jgi:hypothetical protein